MGFGRTILPGGESGAKFEKRGCGPADNDAYTASAVVRIGVANTKFEYSKHIHSQHG